MPRPTLQYAVLKIQETTVISLSQVHKSNHKTPCSHPASCYFIGLTVTRGAIFKRVSLSATSIGYLWGRIHASWWQEDCKKQSYLPLKTAISTKSCYIRSLCNVFISDLAADFLVILFSKKESSCCSWRARETTVVYFPRACILQGEKSDHGRWDSLESSVNRTCYFLNTVGVGGVGILLFYLMWLIQEC